MHALSYVELYDLSSSFPMSAGHCSSKFSVKVCPMTLMQAMAFGFGRLPPLRSTRWPTSGMDTQIGETSKQMQCRLARTTLTETRLNTDGYSEIWISAYFVYCI